MPAPHCPICSKPAEPAFKPFCSPRCRQVDLGRWFSEGYAIPALELPDDEPDMETEDDNSY